MLTGYLGEQIEEHFADGTDFGLNIQYSRETTPLGTGGALREAIELIDESFLTTSGRETAREVLL